MSTRDLRGRFVRGNPGGPGNPMARQSLQLKAALLAAVTVEDIQAIVSMLVDRALSGDVAAAKEVLDRCLGRPGPAVVALEADPAAGDGDNGPAGLTQAHLIRMLKLDGWSDTDDAS